MPVQALALGSGPASVIGAFLSGAAMEGLNVLWVHLAERNRAAALGAVSAAAGFVSLVGIGASLRYLPAAAAFIAGHAAGPMLVAWAKGRRARSRAPGASA